MIQIKKLKKPSKRSGRLLAPGAEFHSKKYGVRILNTGVAVLYVDSVTPHTRKKPKK